MILFVTVEIWIPCRDISARQQNLSNVLTSVLLQILPVLQDGWHVEEHYRLLRHGSALGGVDGSVRKESHMVNDQRINGTDVIQGEI